MRFFESIYPVIRADRTAGVVEAIQQNGQELKRGDEAYAVFEADRARILAEKARKRREIENYIETFFNGGGVIFNPKETFYLYEDFAEKKEDWLREKGINMSFQEHLAFRFASEEFSNVLGEIKGLYCELGVQEYAYKRFSGGSKEVRMNVGGHNSSSDLDRRFGEREHDYIIVDNRCFRLGSRMEYEKAPVLLPEPDNASETVAYDAKVINIGEAKSAESGFQKNGLLKLVLSAQKNISEEERKGIVMDYYLVGGGPSHTLARLFMYNEQYLSEHGFRKGQLKRHYVDFCVGYKDDVSVMLSELNNNQLREFLLTGKLSGLAEATA